MLKTSCCEESHECSRCETDLQLVFSAASEQSNSEYPTLPSEDSFRLAPPGLAGMQIAQGSDSQEFDDRPVKQDAQDDFVHKSSMLTTPGAAGQTYIRSVSLRKTLRRAMDFWFSNPRALNQRQKEKLFQASAPSSGFNIFLSHTWKTKGRWKFLSLLLQFGWPSILASWAFALILAFVLCMADILPLFSTYEVHAIGFDGVIPSACWMQVFGLLGILAGCTVFPYLPCYKSDQCFLDYVCINQSEISAMQQGIMSISAFLAASEELRVLWSAPLLSRLWCVFEIAAYQKLNPNGRIVIAPMNNETSACMIFLWFQLTFLSFWLARAGPDGGNPTALLLVIAVFSVGFIPAVAHAIWRNHRSSAKLRHELANFDVTNANCNSDFDRQCIYDAIITWHGSLEAFSAHVRGPFSQEVLDLMRAGGSLSSHYIVLPITPLVCLSLDNVVALIKAGAPAKAVIALFFNYVVAFDLVFLPALAIFFAWMARKGLWMGKWRCKPLGLEIAVVLMLAFIIFAAAAFFSVVITAQSLQMSILWNSSAFLFGAVTWWCCWRVK